MKKMIALELISNPAIATLSQIPVLGYHDFRDQTVEMLNKESCHCVNYFAHNEGSSICFYIIVANDVSNRICIYSHRQNSDIDSLDSIARDCFPLHIFEREIYESTGINFEGHPWLKPVRYPFDRKRKEFCMSDYPFYSIGSGEIHEVAVGPIHAGIIEPGHFRFQCYGEKVLHLEIQLGYQHRGVESLFVKKSNLLQRSLLAESIAGDTAIGHSLAFAQLAETMSGMSVSQKLEAERIIALELERVAVHIGDTAALCGDIAYQIGQVACEALRTIVINTMQDWCGNRFGKGAVRPGGSYYPVNPDIAGLINERVKEVQRRFKEITRMIYSDSGVIARFENTGTVSQKQAFLAGAVGMAARTAGIARDIRSSHPFQAYKEFAYKPVILDQGDVLSRALLRKNEVDLSCEVIYDLLERLKKHPETGAVNMPDYTLKFKPGILCISLTEGWRGEICHAAITGSEGQILLYKIKDPSLHNWQMLALAVREQEISDFPVCNKSFNLSYCGNDL